MKICSRKIKPYPLQMRETLRLIEEHMCAISGPISGRSAEQIEQNLQGFFAGLIAARIVGEVFIHLDENCVDFAWRKAGDSEWFIMFCKGV